ncbi:cysteine protease ATG4B isoform X1 [Canna indica]|uniref:Cysteine protease n=1 Tax=Canna indica TaxID=4628 RepID=A0AAQ3KS40_9LILI|nr:cysteine protease ATG4B isoform X1 [Canna indica]
MREDEEEAMTDLLEKALDSKFPAGNSDEQLDRDSAVANSEEKPTHCSSLRASFLASFFTSTLSFFEKDSTSYSVERKPSKSRSNGWVATLKKVVTSGPMRRFQERILGTGRADTLSSTSDIWFLGRCYKLSLEESSNGCDPADGYAAFLEDFSSRIWITYRKGFDPIGDSKFTCDVNWGCMIRSSQMLVAQALILHHLGRSWKRPLQKPYDPQYIEILHLFGDSETSAFSIHNLLQAGRSYGLAAGSWLGPYAMCRTWETLARANKEQAEHEKCKENFPFVLYIVSGDEDGERGGAPVICMEIAARLCSDFSKGLLSWEPILLLVPLVLGLERINPRYIPLLLETFTFPQSVGILGGKPGTSTYIVGVQDNKALYLDPHEVQQAVDIKRDDLEADTSSYHCSMVRHLPLDTIDPSLAIGFYCRDKEDFEDLCTRASKLAEKSNGAPLFTVVHHLQPAKPIPYHDSFQVGAGYNNGVNAEDFDGIGDHVDHEDEWQLI